LGALESGPVAVAHEPVKQDLIDNEILESVPKTMKAKVQLLLKKMKSSPDISWNVVPILVG
jgi:citrate lyase gamma subunit